MYVYNRVWSCIKAANVKQTFTHIESPCNEYLIRSGYIKKPIQFLYVGIQFIVYIKHINWSNLGIDVCNEGGML